MQSKEAKAASSLTVKDWQWLHRYADDDQTEPAPLETLARLEASCLLMRGWGRHYVVTGKGQKMLRERAELSSTTSR